MEFVDLVPNSLTFRVINTLEIQDESDVPEGYTGRVRRYLDGTLVYVAWYRNGVLHNPGRSSPAYRRLRADGAVKYELFYAHGMLNDPPEGPAVRGYYADGLVHYEEHYRGGQRHDAVDGTPAVRKWRHDGSLRHELRYAFGRKRPRVLQCSLND